VNRLDQLLGTLAVVGIAWWLIDEGSKEKKEKGDVHVDPPVDLSRMTMAGPVGIPVYRGPAGLLGPGKQIPAPPDDGLLDGKSVNERLGVKDDSFDEAFWIEQLGWGEPA
jgi:hypothetical protein